MYEMHLIIHTIDELSRMSNDIALSGRGSVRAYVKHTFFSSSRTAYNLGNPGANLIYLCTPRQFFMGTKSFIGTTEILRIFFLNDRLNYTMKNCMVSMATVNVILKHGGVHKILIISSL